MKIFKATVLAVLLATASFGQEVLTPNMTLSELGLGNIQKGFLYNNVELIKTGAEQIKKANALFHDQEETKKYLPKEKRHLSNIAFNAAKRIEGSVEEMLNYLDAKQTGKAEHAYSGIINACGACHAVVRGW